jgi:hypothetical protein
MKTGAHLFLSGGAMLPRWKEAFKTVKGPASQAAKTAGAPGEVDLLWLRARHGVPIESQILGIPAHLQAIPLVVLSDEPSDEEALAAFSAGARGYCNSHAAPSLLQQISGVVLSGGLWIGESLMHRLMTAIERIRKSGNEAVPMAPWMKVAQMREVSRDVVKGPNKVPARPLPFDGTNLSPNGSVLRSAHGK